MTDDKLPTKEKPKPKPAPRPDKGGSYRAEDGLLVQSRPPTKSKEG